jgi:hypothetical protein
LFQQLVPALLALLSMHPLPLLAAIETNLRLSCLWRVVAQVVVGWHVQLPPLDCPAFKAHLYFACSA